MPDSKTLPQTDPSALARKLDGHEYPFREAKDFHAEAEAQGLVFAYGMSDDLLEFCGAIEDEIGAWEGATVQVGPSGLIRNECCEGDNCPNWGVSDIKSVPLKAVFHDSDAPYCWTIETAIPHATFDIVEDGEKFSRGVVFGLASVSPPRVIDWASLGFVLGETRPEVRAFVNEWIETNFGLASGTDQS